MTLIKDYTAEDLQNAFDKGRVTGRAERDWVGLTDEEIGAILDDPNIAEKHQGNWLVLPYAYARAIEAKLKEKNHGT